MPDIAENVAVLMEIQEAADHLLGPEKFNAVMVQQAFLEQYREKHGSYKVLIGRPEYATMMDYRDDCTIDMTAQLLEEKAAYRSRVLSDPALRYASKMGCY